MNLDKFIAIVNGIVTIIAVMKGWDMTSLWEYLTPWQLLFFVTLIVWVGLGVRWMWRKYLGHQVEFCQRLQKVEDAIVLLTKKQ